METLLIDVTDLEDARLDLSQKGHLVAEIPMLAARTLISGNKVIIQRRYENAPPDRLFEFSTVAQFSEFWTAFFKKS